MKAKPTIKVRPHTYQPTKAETEEEFTIDAAPEQLAKALLRDVDVRGYPKPRANQRN